MRIGVNIDCYSPGSTQFRFGDLLTGAGNWNLSGVSYPPSTNPLPAAGALMRVLGADTGQHGFIKPGAYTLSVGGTGTIRLQHSDLPGGHQDFTFPVAAGSYPVTFTASDLLFASVQSNSTTDPLHDLHLMAAGASHGDPWHPDFLDAIRPFSVLRSMDWLQTNSSKIAKWGDRPVRPYYELEGFLDLCSRTGAVPWLNLPHLAATIAGPTDYAAGLGQLLAQYPSIDVAILEYSNEVWNYAPGFNAQANYVQSIAPQLTDPVTGKAGVGSGGAYGWLASQVFDAVEAANGGATRIVRTFCGQAGYVQGGLPGGMMGYFRTAQPHFGWRVDAIGCAPYTDWPGVAPFTNKILAELYAVDPSGAIDLLCAGLIQGVSQAIPWCEAWAAYADSLGVPLLYYEMAPWGNKLWKDPTTLPVVQAAVSDPRMGDVWAAYLDAIGEYAALGNYYSFCCPGVWGLTPDLGCTATDPKRAAVLGHAARWDLPRAAARPAPAPTPA